MKRVVLFFLSGVFSLGALAYSPDEYALQVLQKDVPRSVRWFGKIAQASQMSQVEVYELYQSSLPETQVNKQLGISAKGSMERMLLLLEGARYFEQIQKAPLEFQNKKELVTRILQVAKDEMDRFQYGEDPQNLLEDWRNQGFEVYGMDFAKFSADLLETFTEIQKLLSQPVMIAAEAKVDAQVQNEENSEEKIEESSASVEVVAAESFEKQRLQSYIESAEAGVVAGECQGAILWKTDQAESCQNDESVECDRSYARQCKKLQ